jgi:hypothetical protein
MIKAEPEVAAATSGSAFQFSACQLFTFSPFLPFLQQLSGVSATRAEA